MKRAILSSSPAPRALRVLILAAALMVVACDNDVNISPTAPTWPDPVPGARTLYISGTLTAKDGACLEATMLYDGEELAGARVVCSKAQGCAKLDLEAVVHSASGHHTISFQILRQSKKAIDYLAEGTVLVSREGIALGGITLDLGPTRAKLRAGRAVTFEIDFRD